MLQLILFACLFYSQGLLAKTSKEIWQDYSGTTECEVGYCADEIPAAPLELTLNYLHNNAGLIENLNYVAIADFRLHSSLKRLFILNLNDGSVESMLVAHGKKSEGRSGMAEKFSNVNGSKMSSLGFYLTEEAPYEGKHGQSLRLEGLSTTNSNALERGIVIHAADYVSEAFVKERKRLGLSFGCPAVSAKNIESVISKMKGRGLYLIYYNQQ